MTGEVVGSYVVAFEPVRLSWALAELMKRHSRESLSRLKVRSGEHLAAILTTACLATAPIGLDVDGGIDLLFDLEDPAAEIPPGFGCSGKRYAAFEVKSLKGEFRRYDAAISHTRSAGREPDERTHSAVIRSLNDIVRNEGLIQLDAARDQLSRKAGPKHAKHAFLVTQFFDHPFAEYDGIPLVAHHLEPLSDVTDLDAVWMLWAPDTFVVWSREHQRWTNVVIGSSNPADAAPDDDLAPLQQIEARFLEHTEAAESPYLFRISAGASD